MVFNQKTTEYIAPSIEVSEVYLDNIILAGSDGVFAGEIEEIHW